jgi:predicted transcriptional regulator
MSNQITIRLDPRRKAELLAIAKHYNTSLSVVVRNAIHTEIKRRKRLTTINFPST